MTLDDLRKIAEAAASVRTYTEEYAEFIATFNPSKVLELLDRIERLRHQNSRLMAGNFTPAERADWRGAFIRADDENRHLRARLAAVEEMHVPQPGLGPAYCTECDQLHPCDTTKAARGE